MRIIRIGKKPGRSAPPRKVEVGGAYAPGFHSPDGGKAAARVEKKVRSASYVLVSFLFSALLFALFLVGDHGFLQVRRQRQQLTTLHEEVSALAARNARIEEEIAALKTEPRAVERIAREDLKFVRPDEIVLVLPKGWRNRVLPETAPRGRGAARPAPPR